MTRVDVPVTTAAGSPCNTDQSCRWPPSAAARTCCAPPSRRPPSRDSSAPGGRRRQPSSRCDTGTTWWEVTLFPSLTQNLRSCDKELNVLATSSQFPSHIVEENCPLSRVLVIYHDWHLTSIVPRQWRDRCMGDKSIRRTSSQGLRNTKKQQKRALQDKVGQLQATQLTHSPWLTCPPSWPGWSRSSPGGWRPSCSGSSCGRSSPTEACEWTGGDDDNQSKLEFVHSDQARGFYSSCYS